jgi:hypothetical protein
MLGAVEPACSRCNTLVELPAKEVSMKPNIADIIHHHVAVESGHQSRVSARLHDQALDARRLVLFHDHLGNPIPSPAARVGNRRGNS